MFAVLVGILVDPAVELDINRYIASRKFPRVEVKPVIRDFDLVSIFNLLLKDTVSVSQAVAPCCIVERGHRVEEASCESAETTIAESRIVLLLDNVFNSETQLTEALCSKLVQYVGLLVLHTFCCVLQTYVKHSIVQSSAHQEFQ